MRDLFGDNVEALDMSRGEYIERSPNVEEYAALFERTFGPVIAVRGLLAADADRAAAFDREFREYVTLGNTGAPGGPAEYPYEYLLVVARKRGA